MKLTDPIEALRRKVAEHPTQYDAAKSLGISAAYLSDMVNGRRNITNSILAKLGLKRVVVK